MSQLYRATHRRSYRPVRVPARENRSQSLDVAGKLDSLGGQAVVTVLAALAILDGVMFILVGLR